MALSKATKKFQKNRLSDTLKQRKDFAKVKQRHQQRAKKKARRQEEAGDAEADNAAAEVERDVGAAKLKDMSVDDFFAGDFEIPKEPSLGKRSGKRKRPTKEVENEDSESDDGSSVASIEEHMSLSSSDSENDFADKLDEDDVEDDDATEEAHKADLKTLATNDPEFYEYLKENDAELLDFTEDSNLPDIGDLSDTDNEVEGDPSAVRSTQKDKKIKPLESSGLTKETVTKWVTAMKEQNSLRSLREVVLAFRTAAHLNDDEKEGKEFKYTISNAEVYNQVIFGALEGMPSVLQHHLPVTELASGKVRLATDSKKFRSLTPLLKSHLISVLHLLDTLSDASTTQITLTSLTQLLPYLLSFKKLLRTLVRTVSSIYASASHPETLRLVGFLLLRKLILSADAPLREHILRSAYQSLLQSARSTTQHTLPAINLTKNTSVELWGLVPADQAYTTAFTLIRQLAIHLRTALKNNANDAYKTVYNWQFVHALDFWSRVLSRHCAVAAEAANGKESSLRPLIYPLTQTTLGTLRLIPTAAYFPLRFHLTRSLLRLSRATNTFIPLAAALYEVLQSAEMRRPGKPGTLRPLNFEITVRAPKGYLRTRAYQDGIGEQVAELMSEFFALWTKSVAFPELALPVIVMLKRWIKDVSPYTPNAAVNGANGKGKGKGKRGAQASSTGGNKNSKVNSAISLLVQKLDANAKFIEEKRAKVDFAPSDRAGVEGFLKELEWNKTPLGAFVEGQRAQREERNRVLEEGRNADEKERKAAKRDEESTGGAEGFEGEEDDDTNDDEDMAED